MPHPVMVFLAATRTTLAKGFGRCLPRKSQPDMRGLAEDEPNSTKQEVPRESAEYIVADSKSKFGEYIVDGSMI
jgi:hypothetical protein